MTQGLLSALALMPLPKMLDALNGGAMLTSREGRQNRKLAEEHESNAAEQTVSYSAITRSELSRLSTFARGSFSSTLSFVAIEWLGSE